MAYLITEFDGVPLPLYDAKQDDNAAEAESALLDSIGGVFDYYGTLRRLARRYRIEATGTYVGETTYLVDEAGNYLVDEDGNYLIAGAGVNRLRAQVQALRSKVGVRGTLTRIRQDDDVEQWITARLLAVNHAKEQEEMALLATVTCVFEAQHTAWRATTATTSSATPTSGVTTALNVSNAGELAVADATITVACSSGTITQVDIDGVGVGIDLVWTGSLASGSTLTIDCGAQTVRIGTTDSYSGFSLGASHTVRGWLPLEPGLTPLLVTTTGGDATVTVSHYGQYP